jgi:hypothetical protein
MFFDLSARSVRWTVPFVVGCLLVGRLAAEETQLAPFAVYLSASKPAAERKIRKSLTDATTLEFIETPLRDVLDYLKDVHGIEIQIDERALRDAGVATDAPITLNLNGITLRSALRLVLAQLDLTYVVRDEVLLITTDKAASEATLVRVYRIEELLEEDESTEAVAEALERILAAHPKADGFHRMILPFGKLLVVRSNEAVQREVAEILSVLRAGKTGKTGLPVVVHVGEISLAPTRELGKAGKKQTKTRGKRPRPVVDPFSPCAEDPFSRRDEDPFSRCAEDPFSQRAEDPFSQRVADPFGQRAKDPFSLTGEDPSGQSGEDPFGQRVPERSGQMDD